MVLSKSNFSSTSRMFGLKPAMWLRRLSLEDGLLRAREHTVQATKYGERQDHILVLAALEGVADEVSDAPEELTISLWFTRSFPNLFRHTLGLRSWLCPLTVRHAEWPIRVCLPPADPVDHC